jgi:hypothetical protein
MPSRKTRLAAIVAAAIISLAGCVSQPPPPSAPPGDVGPSQDAPDNRALESRDG